MENIRKDSHPDNGTDRVFDIYGLNMGEKRLSIAFTSFLSVSIYLA